MKTALEIKKDVHRFRTCTEESIIESMDSYAEQMAIGFDEWKEKLSPSQLVTVHPPAGSGGTHGIYNLSTKELYQLYLKSIGK